MAPTSAIIDRMPTPTAGVKPWKGKAKPVTLVATVVTKENQRPSCHAVGREQPIQNDEAGKDADQAQHDMRKREVRHTEDHHAISPGFSAALPSNPSKHVAQPGSLFFLD
jgi:hypothetical protein